MLTRVFFCLSCSENFFAGGVGGGSLRTERGGETKISLEGLPILSSLSRLLAPTTTKEPQWERRQKCFQTIPPNGLQGTHLLAFSAPGPGMPAPAQGPGPHSWPTLPGGSLRPARAFDSWQPGGETGGPPTLSSPLNGVFCLPTNSRVDTDLQKRSPGRA